MTEATRGRAGDGLTFQEVKVLERVGGVEVNARAALCGICASDTFVIFIVEGQAHPHLQCAGCDTCFCYGGECDR